MPFISNERASWLGRNVLPHEPALRRWLERLRPNGFNIDDVIQETYTRIAAMENLHHIRDTKSHMFQAAHSIAMEHLRQMKVVQITAASEAEEAQTAPSSLPASGQAADADEIRWLAELIGAMPAKTRVLFFLRRVRGLPLEKASAQLDISKSAASERMSRGLLLMLNFLRDGGKPSSHSSITPSVADNSWFNGAKNRSGD